ncbi:hypothetical protein [Cellulomonas fengjieae]|uniref:hypothetical protein n=1 Tax=Cellulomonas fengjieae TaxID=2819978 RepID=UPI001AAF34A3|nr:hypothetical protein [Cellulomonas fengjieae]MBO3101972.1 hypothetical protein [Cellulomonas fengjieae]
MSVDPRFERSVQCWLRAYPRRWRSQRADEVTAVLADLADPGATRLDARTATGLVLAGWRTRARTRPPLPALLAYRVADRRLPARYRGWVRDDVEGALFSLRAALAALWGVGLVLVVQALGADEVAVPWDLVAVFLLVAVLGMALHGPRWRRKHARKHLVPDEEEELTADSLMFGWIMRDRLTARRSTGMLTLGLAVAGVVTAPHAPPAVLGVALLTGALLAVLARLRLRRAVAGRPPQPARRLVRPTVRHVVLTAAGVAVASVGTSWLGRPDVLSVAALAVLPGMVVTWHAARSGPADLALVDVLTIAVTGAPPPVDTFREGLVPALVSTD